MKKQLNTTAIINELKGGSSFFPRHKSPSQSKAEPNNKPVHDDVSPTTHNVDKGNLVFENPKPYDRTDVTIVRPNGHTVRTDARTEGVRRATKRHPFEIYEDQLERLKKRKAQAMLDNHDTSMSAMVREALDNYLDKQSS